MKKREYKSSIDISDDEIDRICDYLDEYLVEFPPDKDKLKSINEICEHTPKTKLQKYKEIYSMFSERVRFEISYINKYYYLISLLIISIAIIFVQVLNYDYYEVMMAISPISLIWGIYELFRGRNEGMLELEMTMKYSEKSLFLSKFFIISIFTISINIFMSLILNILNPKIDMAKLIILWITPMNIMACLSLFLSTKIRGNISVAVSLCFWIVIYLMVRNINLFNWTCLLINLGSLIATSFILWKYLSKDIYKFNFEVVGE